MSGANQGKHALSNSRTRYAAKQRASSIAAAIASIAIVVIAAMSWRISSTEHDEGTSSPISSNIVEITFVDALTRPDAIASLKTSLTNAVEAQKEANQEKEETEPTPVEDEPIPLASFSPTDLDAIPSGTQLAAFSIFGDAPTLSDEESAVLLEAIDAIEDMGNVGMVFLDASTGNGIAYNAGAAIYGASSFKGPYAVYVCQALVDNDAITLGTPVSLTSDNPGSISISSSSSWAKSGSDSFATRELITAAVIESDNDAFGMLRNQYDVEGYDEWIAQLGIQDAPRDPLSWYPSYCAQSSTKLWVNALGYFESETPTSKWLEEVFQQTQTSFIRDAVIASEGGSEATVLDKAGWIADSEPAYNAVCDAGIIEVDGRTYIMSIMTSQPDCTEARENVRALARALFETRDTLS